MKFQITVKTGFKDSTVTVGNVRELTDNVARLAGLLYPTATIIIRRSE